MGKNFLKRLRQLRNLLKTTNKNLLIYKPKIYNMDTNLKELHEYNLFANKLFIQVFEKEKVTHEQSMKLFSHLLSAHHIWISRIYGFPAKLKVWDIHPTAQFLNIAQENFDQTIAILSDKNISLEKRIDYTNTQGHAYTNSVRDMLTHSVNHASYHRGQVAHFLRQLNIQPPVTDYIHYKRTL
jgi:uncharacterized damage-inducible protein DinB